MFRDLTFAFLPFLMHRGTTRSFPFTEGDPRLPAEIGEEGILDVAFALRALEGLHRGYGGRRD